jgi:hypothetical protein
VTAGFLVMEPHHPVLGKVQQTELSPIRISTYDNGTLYLVEQAQASFAEKTDRHISLGYSKDFGIIRRQLSGCNADMIHDFVLSSDLIPFVCLYPCTLYSVLKSKEDGLVLR